MCTKKKSTQKHARLWLKWEEKEKNSENHTLIANFDEMEGEGRWENEAAYKRKWKI
jgi:hypothetical protein